MRLLRVEMKEVSELNRIVDGLLLEISSKCVGPFTRFSHGFGWLAHGNRLLNNEVISLDTYQKIKEWYTIDFYEGKVVYERDWLSMKGQLKSAIIVLKSI